MQGAVIAGTHSGCGKTTIALGVLAAFKKMGEKVQAFKAGPDFIDSGLHRIITGRHSRNLDLWMCGKDYVSDCFSKNSIDVDISIIEGVMGFFDGEFSTAALAAHLNLPVILVVDAYGMAESAGAIIKGFRDWGLGISIAGVIFNRVASASHYERLKSGVSDIPVLGYLPRDAGFEIPHRHLGLTVAEEKPLADENIDRLADAVLKNIDVRKILECGIRNVANAPSYPPLKIRGGRGSYECKKIPKSKIRIALAYDKAFCFYYEDNLDLLKEAGAEIITFSPLSDSKIPDDADAVYIGGGYPELHARELSKNASVLESINNWADSDKPMYVECGGLIYLSKGIWGFDGTFFPMAGVFSFETEMRKGRANLGYRAIKLRGDCIFGKKGDCLRGHEFHYSEIKDGIPNAEYRMQTKDNPSIPPLNKGGQRGVTAVYSIRDGNHKTFPDEGYRFKNTLASYIHIHFGSNSKIAQNFVNFIQECHSRANGNPVSCAKTMDSRSTDCGND